MGILIIAILAGLSAISLGGAGIAIQRSRREKQIARQRSLDVAPTPAAGAPQPAAAPGEGRRRLLSTLGRLGRGVGGGGTSRSLAQQLATAGFHSPSAPTLYLGAKAGLFLLGLIGGAVVLLPTSYPLLGRLFGCVFAGSFLSFVPNLVVTKARTKRRKSVDRHLPDAVDLLEICVASGMGLDAAWAAVNDEIRSVSDVFADEMELTTLEISLGIPRAEAMRHMATRTGVEDLSSLVALLVQAERLGASIGDALTTFARGLREIRSQRAEESAEKMSVKLMFPMVMFIFPALLLIMLGPAVIQLVRAMNQP